jgi:hypothetical protein
VQTEEAEKGDTADVEQKKSLEENILRQEAKFECELSRQHKN